MVNEYTDGVTEHDLKEAVATEKLDGMNVRATVRNGSCVRLEKRRNPDKIQKQKGIVDPWYVDASEYESQDKHLFDALKNTVLGDLPDGEWSGEALGPDIQGNPLGLPSNRIVFFTLGQAPIHLEIPTDFNGLKKLFELNERPSSYGLGGARLEGFVWHHPDGRMFKIKAKDFV